MKVPLDRERSLFARSLLDNLPLDTLDPEVHADLSVSDRQLSAQLPGDGVLCLPMRHRGIPVGALVLGIRQTQISAMVDQSELLLAFAGEAAALLYRATQARLEQRGATAANAAGEDSRIRHLSNQLANPVTVIRNYLHVLDQQLDTGHPGQESLHIVMEETERVADLLRRLGDTTDNAAASQSEIDVNRMIQELVVLAREAELLPPRMTVHQQLDSRLEGLPAPIPVLRKLVLGLFRPLGTALPVAGSVQIRTSAEIWLDGKLFHELNMSIPGDPNGWQREINRQLDGSRQIIRDLGGRLSWSGAGGGGIRVQVLWPDTSTD